MPVVERPGAHVHESVRPHGRLAHGGAPPARSQALGEPGQVALAGLAVHAAEPAGAGQVELVPDAVHDHAGVVGEIAGRRGPLGGLLGGGPGDRLVGLQAGFRRGFLSPVVSLLRTSLFTRAASPLSYSSRKRSTA